MHPCDLGKYTSMAQPALLAAITLNAAGSDLYRMETELCIT